MNLSKIREDKNVSVKKYNLSLRLVLFCSLPRFFLIGPLQLSLSTVKRTKLYRSNIRDGSIFLDCKTVGFFLKISKEIGKAWRKSLTRAKRASLTRP